jgi:hypothetical protein
MHVTLFSEESTLLFNMHRKESVRENAMTTKKKPKSRESKPEHCETPIDPRVEELVTELIGRVADKWTMMIIEVLTERVRSDLPV